MLRACVCVCVWLFLLRFYFCASLRVVLLVCLFLLFLFYVALCVCSVLYAHRLVIGRKDESLELHVMVKADDTDEAIRIADFVCQKLVQELREQKHYNAKKLRGAH